MTGKAIPLGTPNWSLSDDATRYEAMLDRKYVSESNIVSLSECEAMGTAIRHRIVSMGNTEAFARTKHIVPGWSRKTASRTS